MSLYLLAYANGNMVSRSRDAAGCGSFRAGSDVCVCHLESTTRTGGGVHGEIKLLHLINHRRRDGHYILVHILTFKKSLSFVLQTLFFFVQGQMRPLASGPALHSPVGYLATFCRHTTYLVTSPLKMYDLCRAPTRENDQAHYIPTEIN